MKTLLKMLKSVLLFPVFVIGELEVIMALIDDLKAAIADVSTKVDAVLANESADAAAVVAAQAAQKTAEDAAAQAAADLATAQTALADAQANAVTQDVVDSVKAVGDKLVPPAPAANA